jgi:hypothetical protein
MHLSNVLTLHLPCGIAVGTVIYKKNSKEESKEWELHGGMEPPPCSWESRLVTCCLLCKYSEKCVRGLKFITLTLILRLCTKTKWKWSRPLNWLSDYWRHASNWNTDSQPIPWIDLVFNVSKDISRQLLRDRVTSQRLRVHWWQRNRLHQIRSEISPQNKQPKQ